MYFHLKILNDYYASPFFSAKLCIDIWSVNHWSSKFFKMLTEDPWKITMLTDNIGIFTERGGTIAFHFSKEGTTVIDAQFPDTAVHLIDELKKKK